MLLVKLVVDAADSRVLGAQVVGPGTADKRVDVVAAAMHFGARVDDLADIDLCYAPPYSSPIDPVATAANVVRNKRDGLAHSITPMEVKEKLDRGDDFLFLDVRTPGEYQMVRIEDPRVKLIPLGQLRRRLEELPRDKEIVTFCALSLRGYEAQRILNGAGFSRVRFMDGGVTAWPYSVSRKQPS
jgi:rhodanese-related sulfurtransferase